MAEKGKVWKDKLEKNRYKILYIAAIYTLFFSLAGWALLPDQVMLVAESAGGAPMAKNAALLANIGVTSVFSVLFAIKPRELVYFVALCLGMIVTAVPILNLLGGAV